VSLKAELEHEKRRRSHKEEYESMAKIINQLPTRSDTHKLDCLALLFFFLFSD